MSDKPTPLSGFPELLPEHRAVEQRVIDVLRETFELHGFAGIETRAVEPLDRLRSQGETSKEVYVLRRLHAEEGSADSGLGLHFDLTVPFARYVLENAGKLEFPFRRYQIQRAWRGERPQEGRFREFTQADIDVVGRDELPFHHDIEVARVMVEAMTRLDFLPPMTLQVNNRKLIEGYYLGIGVAEPLRAMQAIDHLDKMPRAGVKSLLTAIDGITDELADRCLDFATISTENASFVHRVRALGAEHPLLDEGLDELGQLMRALQSVTSDRVKVVADLSIARGLGYYTGTVFETRVEGLESLGSICSGGRYDTLASDGSTTYPGVGISLGVSRLLVPLISRGVVPPGPKVPSQVLVALVDEESRASSDQIAAALRRRGIPTEVAASAQRFGKQIRYAERRGIRFVWFPASGDDGTHEVKDIRSGEQVPADPDRWTPSEEPPQQTSEEPLEEVAP
jgi:histidyl-tRNA synthetase